MDASVIPLALEVNWRNLALGHEVFDAGGATFVRNRDLPQIYDANFVFGITASEPAEIDRLLAGAAREYSHARRLTFRADRSTPPAFEARLARDGYQCTDALVLLLEGPPQAEPGRFDIRAIEDDAAWRAYARLKHLDWQSQHPDDVTVADGLVASNRVKCPPVQYLLAYQDERAVGHCSAWEGPNGVGQIEDLFVDSAYRRRGIATALIDRCARLARARGAGPLVIVVDPANSAKGLYASLGWRPITAIREYGRVRGDETTSL